MRFFFLILIFPLSLSAQGRFNYKVELGDTLSEIAKLFSISESEIQKANPKIKKKKILAGQTIKIPLEGKRLISYQIKSGDSLSVISLKYNNTISLLKKLNPPSKIEKFWAGTTIKILQNYSPPRKRSFPKLLLTQIKHKVSKGENFHSIAKDYGVSYQTLQRSHQKKYQRKTLYSGDTLDIIKRNIKNPSQSDEIIPQTRTSKTSCRKDKSSIAGLIDVIPGKFRHYRTKKIHGAVYKSIKNRDLIAPTRSCVLFTGNIPTLGEGIILEKGKYHIFLLSNGLYNLNLRAGDEVDKGEILGKIKKHYAVYLFVANQNRWIRIKRNA